MEKTVLHNGKVYVEKGDFREAVLVEDGIIAMVGSNEEILEAAGDAKKIDCEGRTVIPGINDSHMHILMVGEMLSEAQIGDSKSIDDMIERCKKFAAENPELVKKGMHSQGWNQDLFTEGEVRLPNRHDLDKISTEYPIVLERVCGHTCTLNTKALEMLGIGKNHPQVTKAVRSNSSGRKSKRLLYRQLYTKSGKWFRNPIRTKAVAAQSDEYCVGTLSRACSPTMSNG